VFKNVGRADSGGGVGFSSAEEVLLWLDELLYIGGCPFAERYSSLSDKPSD
jgi:hypothetical protein